MKTEKTNQENEKMEKGQAAQPTKNWQSGVSSSIGAAVGVVAGSMAQPAFAEEHTVEESVVQPQHTDNSATSPANPVYHEPAPEQATHNNSTTNPAQQPVSPTPQPQPTPQTDEEGITVISCETVTNEDGSQMDVAEITIAQHNGLIADIDQDGIADVIGVDIDNNGTFTDDEIANIENENIQMNDLANAVQTDPLAPPAIVDNGLDYTNDANVEDYMA